MITITEITRWTGVSVFELLLHSLACLTSSCLLYARLAGVASFDYGHVFMPLFVASALNCYFLFIVFTRTVIEERQFKRAFLANVCNFLRAVMIFLFEVLLCHKVNTERTQGQVATDSTYTTVFMPVWVLMIALGFRACRLLQ